MNRYNNLLQTLAITIALLAVTAISHAVAIYPTSYDMPNGSGTSRGGEYNYWDANYTGSGNKNVDGDFLSGGLGKLTDGVTADKSWEFPDTSVSPYIYGTRENLSGTGPYVGWTWGDPTITFHFGGADISRVTFYVDDPKDAHGGVAAPLSFDINSVNHPVTNSGGIGPLAITFDTLGFTNITDLTVKINRDLSSPELYWAFMSEVTFDDGRPAPVPEPATLVLLGAGIGGLALLRNRRKI